MWDVFSDVSDAFANLGNNQSPITEDDLKLFEQYVVFMYDRASTVTSVNEARLDLFARNQRGLRTAGQSYYTPVVMGFITKPPYKQ